MKLHQTLKILSLIILAVLSSTLISAQTPAPTPTEDEEEVLIVDKFPQFPGGDKALMKFIRKHLEYPKEIRKAGIEGTVYIAFIIDKSGNVVHESVEPVKSLHPVLDAEAVKLVKRFPKWTPGYLQGEPTDVTYNLPVRFKL